jgi:GNAT superfamily N-acetyltransferase
MIIRPATPDDADNIAHVNVEGWRTAYKDLLSAEYLAALSTQTRRDRWREILTQTETNKITFVAERDGEIIGFVSCGPERTNDSRFVGEIYVIYLLKDHCRMGIGTALFRRGVEFLLNHRMNAMKVWVLRDNPYRTFYERQG